MIHHVIEKRDSRTFVFVLVTQTVTMIFFLTCLLFMSFSFSLDCEQSPWTKWRRTRTEEGWEIGDDGTLWDLRVERDPAAFLEVYLKPASVVSITLSVAKPMFSWQRNGSIGSTSVRFPLRDKQWTAVRPLGTPTSTVISDTSLSGTYAVSGLTLMCIGCRDPPGRVRVCRSETGKPRNSTPGNTGRAFVSGNGGFAVRTGDGGSRPFPLLAVNSYYLALVADGHAATDRLLDDAVQAGFNCVRVWAFASVGDLETGHPVTLAHGPVSFRYVRDGDVRINTTAVAYYLDYVVAAAKRRSLKLILCMENNWAAYGGADQQVLWLNQPRSGSPPTHEQFFIRPESVYLSLSWFSFLAQRYQDEESVFSFDLINEPRCSGSPGYLPTNRSACNRDEEVITDWIIFMAEFLADQSIMVTAGTEGFFNTNDGVFFWDNGAEGYDWAKIRSLWSLDFSSFHMYPQSWLALPLPDEVLFEFARYWIWSHSRAKNGPKKPVLLEEFGWHVQQLQPVPPLNVTDNIEGREQYFSYVLELAESVGMHSSVWMLISEYYENYDGFSMSIQSPSMQNVLIPYNNRHKNV